MILFAGIRSSLLLSMASYMPKRARTSGPVECPRHPASRKALSFCFDCRVPFCFSCLERPETSHFGHNTQLLADAFRSCATQLHAARTASDEAAFSNRNGIANREERVGCLEGRIWEELGRVDSFCDDLVKLVETTRSSLHFRLFAAADIAQHQVDKQQTEKSEASLLNALRKLEGLIKLTETQSETETLMGYEKLVAAPDDVNRMRTRSAQQLGTLPVLFPSLTSLSAELRKSMQNFSSAANELERAVRALQFEKPVEDLQLVEAARFGRETLKIPTDKYDVAVIGIAAGDTADSIYFCDTLNGAVKRLDLRTRRCDLVRFKFFQYYLFPYFTNIFFWLISLHLCYLCLYSDKHCHHQFKISFWAINFMIFQLVRNIKL